MLLRLRTRSSMERGADLSFLSCFPGEKEFLFPPLCYLQPLRMHDITIAKAKIRVVEVEPRM